MKKFIETVKNIWSIEDLRNKIFITLSFMVIYRLAAQVTLPRWFKENGREFSRWQKGWRMVELA